MADLGLGEAGPNARDVGQRRAEMGEPGARHMLDSGRDGRPSDPDRCRGPAQDEPWQCRAHHQPETRSRFADAPVGANPDVTIGDRRRRVATHPESIERAERLDARAVAFDEVELGLERARHPDRARGRHVRLGVTGRGDPRLVGVDVDDAIFVGDCPGDLRPEVAA